MNSNKDRMGQILETALSVFARYGFKKTTMEDIAKELGMTQSNLYFYVKNKKDLYELAVLEAITKWRKHMHKAFLGEKDLVRSIISMSEAGFDYILKNNDLRMIFVNDQDLLLRPYELIHKSETIARTAEASRFGLKMLKQSLKKGIEEKRFRNFNTDIISVLLGQIYMTFIKQIFVLPEVISRKEMTKEIVNLVLYGILNSDKKDKFNIAYEGYGKE